MSRKLLKILFIVTLALTSLLVGTQFVASAANIQEMRIGYIWNRLFSTTADITITATPLYAMGELTATYVDDTHVRLDWSKTGDVENVIIRAKYDEAPSSITDGYEIYSGDGIQAFDTGLNLNETFSTIYYVAYAQDEGGITLAESEATMESPHMAELSTQISTLTGEVILLIIFIAVNALAFWQRHIFLYLMVVPADVIYGLYKAANATAIYDSTWVIGIVIAILGLFCLFRVGMKLFNKDY